MARHFFSSLARAKNESELRMAGHFFAKATNGTPFLRIIVMYYVYIIQSINSPQKIYTGFLKNIDGRLEGHNSGRSAYTSKFKPWKIVCYCAFSNKEKALDFERYLKTSSGIAFKNKRLI